MIWNSLLLSNGSIFTFTQPSRRGAIAASSSAVMPRETPSATAMWNQRPHDAAVEPREEILVVLEVAGCDLPGPRARRQLREYFPPHRRMRTAAHGVTMNAMSQRPEHRRAGADRDRPHVGPHQAADERHRQHGGDDGEGGEDRGIADFAHRLDGDGGPAAAPVLRQVKVPHDVLDDHDGVVHEDADAEDEREERDAVQREAVEIEDQQREREGGRNGHRDDAGLAPAEREPDERATPKTAMPMCSSSSLDFSAAVSP